MQLWFTYFATLSPVFRDVMGCERSVSMRRAPTYKLVFKVQNVSSVHLLAYTISNGE